MSETATFDSLSLTNQVVLLGVADLAADDETPIQTHTVRQHCRQHLENVDTEVVGTITEADVIRSLYRLEDAGLVEEREPSSSSPTGKGRPAYSLAVSVDAVYDGVADVLLEESAD
ncbi:hypothetical protein [Natrinema sp. 1APR25-10V2]|uniref:hypothetical protein n=1 Tax=Natrinema sp. 1APR25-10V2 TaxID=2951081 RepID=UPI002874CB72|nr:hypothetical protein [Natrinema sp. 1APR25-10V2]MDS0473902.1 hypothetical protein [Natrinema sp. 1APR25-10V2]